MRNWSSFASRTCPRSLSPKLSIEPRTGNPPRSATLPRRRDDSPPTPADASPHLTRYDSEHDRTAHDHRRRPLIRRATSRRASCSTSASPASTCYEPAVRAWVVPRPRRAREQAERLTAEVKARRTIAGRCTASRSASRTSSTCSTCRPAAARSCGPTAIARQDATCVERLRQAGAVILGKTVTTAYAYLDPPVTRNPWNLDRTPGGSSPAAPRRRWRAACAWRPWARRRAAR